MKKSIILLAIVALAATGSYMVFAADQPAGGGMRGGGGMMGGGGGGMMGGGGGGMMGGRGAYGAAMGRGVVMDAVGTMMSNSAMVGTPDGGVIVMMGSELLKYDKDLNLVKQVDIKFNWENWQKMMAEQRNAMRDGQRG